jgi:hypothetical protein
MSTRATSIFKDPNVAADKVHYNLYLTTSHFSYIRKEYIYVLILTFCPLSDIILDGIHLNFEVMFPISMLSPLLQMV